MIEFKNVTKKFAQHPVITDLSFSVKPGEIVGLLGPNGAGKTTTLRMLSGVLPPTQGEILINGRDFENEAAAIKRGVGFLPEDNPLYEELTVEEYLDFWASLKAIKASAKARAIKFVVEHCGIGEVYFRPINELSKGFRQRIGLSQALLNQPEILLLDEPTEGLDPNQRRDIAGLITALGEKRTVIISSHVLSEVAKICNRLIIIHRGKIVADDTPGNLRRLNENSKTVAAEIIGAGVAAALAKIKDVVRVETDAPNHYLLTVNGQSDLRRQIFETAVANHWILLELTAKERALEEVFSELTARP